MYVDFANVLKAVGWTDFLNISELGSRDLTIQFLCTLAEENDGISYQFFGHKYSLYWKVLSRLLGFHHCCAVDVEKVTRSFEK